MAATPRRTPPPNMLRSDQAADIARVDRTTIRNWAAQGKISHRWVNGWLWVSAKTIHQLEGTLTAGEVERRLGASPDQVRRAIRSGLTTVVWTPGGRPRLTEAALTELGWVRSDLVLKKAAARMLGVSPKTLAGWVREGRISCVMTPGGHQRFARAELERWVKEEKG